MKKLLLLSLLFVSIIHGMQNPQRPIQTTWNALPIECKQMVLASFRSDTLGKTIKEVHHLSSINKELNSLLNDPITVGNLSTRIASHFKTDSIFVASLIGTKGATDWIKTQFSSNSQLKEGFQDKIFFIFENSSLFRSFAKKVTMNLKEQLERLHKKHINVLARSLSSLVTAGIDINKKGVDSETVLIKVVDNPENLIAPDLVELLLKKGAKPDQRPPRGKTALMRAIYWGGLGASGLTKINTDKNVKLLLKNKADPNLLDNAGKTPLIYAACCQNKEAISLLIQYGANSELRDNDGHIASHYAWGNLEILGILQKAIKEKGQEEKQQGAK